MGLLTMRELAGFAGLGDNGTLVWSHREGRHYDVSTLTDSSPILHRDPDVASAYLEHAGRAEEAAELRRSRTEQHAAAAQWAADRRAAQASDWAHRGPMPDPADAEAWHAWRASPPTGPARTAWLARMDEAGTRRRDQLFEAHIRSALSSPYSSTHRWGQGAYRGGYAEPAGWEPHYTSTRRPPTPAETLAARRAARTREIQAMNFWQSMPRGWVGVPTPPRFQASGYLRSAQVTPSPSSAFEIRPWRPGDPGPQRTSTVTQFTEFHPGGAPTLQFSAAWGAPRTTPQPWTGGVAPVGPTLAYRMPTSGGLLTSTSALTTPQPLPAGTMWT